MHTIVVKLNNITLRVDFSNPKLNNSKLYAYTGTYMRRIQKYILLKTIQSRTIDKNLA